MGGRGFAVPAFFSCRARSTGLFSKDRLDRAQRCDEAEAPLDSLTRGIPVLRGGESSHGEELK